MALDVKELCRLCGKKDEFCKDLKDEDNKNILKMIQEFIEIPFAEHDELPTKVCLNCEDKIESFQLFIVECYNVQETLRLMCLETCEKHPIKVEDDIVMDYNISTIKSEVDELSAEDLVNAINSNECMTAFDADDYNNDKERNKDDDDMSNVTLATLKNLKQEKTSKRNIMTLTETEKKHLKEISDGFDADNYNNDNDDDVMSNVTLATLKDLKQEKTSERNIMTLTETGKKHLKEISDGFDADNYNNDKDDNDMSSVTLATLKDLKQEKTSERKRMTLTKTGKKHLKEISDLNTGDFVNFTCSICQKQCTSWYKLKSHSERLHKIKPVVNCICGITLKSHTRVYKHVADHKNPNIICCDKCPKITKTISAMITHKMMHMPQSKTKFCCSSCDKVFTSKNTLRSHVQIHMPIKERKMYSCDLCEKKFTTRSKTALHRRTVHDKIKQHACELCAYTCGTSTELRRHRACHSDDRPFACRKCDKRFKTYANLRTHMETHEVTSHECPVCSRVLKNRITLRKHLRVHDGERRYVCSHCDKAYKQLQALKEHINTHTGDKPLKCKWCDERFAYASMLCKHRQRRHPDKMAEAQCTTRVSVPEVTATNIVHADTRPKAADVQVGYLKNDAVPPKTDVEAV